MKSEVWIGWLASLSEAYNMAIYIFLVPILVQLGDHQSLLPLYSLVFVGSFFYPVGSGYYGFIGDKRGRQKACVYSTLGLGFATGLMGLVPLHGDVITVVCFLVCICAQYFFSGGEYHSAIIFSLEHAEQKNEGMMSALSCLFAVMGLIIANINAQLALTNQNTLWVRCCFFLGAGGSILSYVLKRHCQETPAFMRLPSRLLKESWISFIKSNFNGIIKTTVLMSFFIISYSFLIIFLPLYFTHPSQPILSLALYGVLLMLAGFLAKHIGINKTLICGNLLFILFIIFSFWCKNLLAIQLLLILPASLVIGPIHSWMLHQFQVQNRCRGICISSALSVSLFGSSTVPLCLMLYEKFHSIALCSLYPLLFAIGSFCCLYPQKKYERCA